MEAFVRGSAHAGGGEAVERQGEEPSLSSAGRGCTLGPTSQAGSGSGPVRQAQVERDVSCRPESPRPRPERAWGGWGRGAAAEAGCWHQQGPLLPSPTIMVENMQMV